MTELKYTKDVGAPDPELKSSPIAEEIDEETDVLRQEEPGEPVSYINNESNKKGSNVKSGTSIL